MSGAVYAPDDPCAGFPDRCPNIVPVPAMPPLSGGGIRCGCPTTGVVMDEMLAALRAALDEDEQAAREALKRTTTTRRMIGGQWVEDTTQPPEWRRSVWSPTRVLRSVEAMRDIVDTHYPIDPCDAHDDALRSVPCDTLLALASIYGIDPQ